MSREDLFKALNDCAAVLSDAHKSLSFARRLNVKPLLNYNLLNLCTKQAFDRKVDNEKLFGDELTKKIDENKRNSVVMRDNATKNWQGRGRGRVSGRRGNYHHYHKNPNRYYHQKDQKSAMQMKPKQGHKAHQNL